MQFKLVAQSHQAVGSRGSVREGDGGGAGRIIATMSSGGLTISGRIGDHSGNATWRTGAYTRIR